MHPLYHQSALRWKAREARMPAMVAGRPCLDFANSIAPRRPEPGAEQEDRIPGYRELLAWAASAGVLTPAQERRLAAAGEADPDGASAVHADALRLREAIYQTF